MSFFLPAVGYALLPAVGPLFSTRCGSALFTSFHQDHSPARIHPVCCFELCLLSGIAVCECVNLAPRAPYTHHLRSVVPWFVKGLRWFDELFARPRADPRVRCAWFGVIQNHSLPSSLHVCVEGVVSRAWFFAAWSWIPPCCVLCNCSVRRREHLVAEPVSRRSAHCAFRRTLLCSVSRDRALDCSGSSGSRRHPSQMISLSTDAIMIWFYLLRPPGLAPAEALLRLYAAVAAAFGCVPRGQRALLDEDMLELIDRSTCLVEPVSVGVLCSSRACAVHAASTSSAASGRCSRISPPRGLVEGLLLPSCSLGVAPVASLRLYVHPSSTRLQLRGLGVTEKSWPAPG